MKKVVRLGQKKRWNEALTRMLTQEEFEKIVIQRDVTGDKRSTFIRSKTVGEEAFQQLKDLVMFDEKDDDEDDEPMVFARTRRNT